MNIYLLDKMPRKIPSKKHTCQNPKVLECTLAIDIKRKENIL
jgi:hypothetical protein